MNTPASYTLNVNGRLIDLSTPQVMGILNCTPDSFYSGSRVETEQAIAARAHEIVDQGGEIIDVGAFSTRPGAAEVSELEEMDRLRKALAIIRRELPDVVLSVDTFRPDVARMAVEEYGVGIINDVSEGGVTGVVNTPLSEADGGFAKQADGATSSEYPAIFRMVARLGVPYILMSVQPTLQTTMLCFARKIQQLRDLGQKDIILDPGFGFGKTLDDNYALMAQIDELRAFQLPVLVGISRKSMIFRLLETTPDDALNGTIALNTVALLKGASILRVHDVKAAADAVRIVEKMRQASLARV